MEHSTTTNRCDSDPATKPKDLKLIVSIIAIAMSLYHLGTSVFGVPIAMIHRPLHVLFAFTLLFLTQPLGGWKTKAQRYTDYLLIAMLFLSTVYLMRNASLIQARIQYITPLTTIQLVLGVAFILVLLEATRRVIGNVLVYVAALFLLYAVFGKYLPVPFWHRGFSVAGIIEQLYLTSDGVWGVPLYVTSTYVFLFILFGSFLVSTGTGDFFTDFARALTGRMIGGPAKTAVVSSALMGMLSGSSVANVVTTGAFTIPMMKKQGYPSHFAGAVEAAASTGGQIMPPVMGAAAFIMVEYTGIPYAQIMKHAMLPAFLYFFAIYVMVHMEAKKLGLGALSKEDLPNVWRVLRSRGYLFVPILAIVYFLFKGFTPARAAFWAIILLIALAFLFDQKNRKNMLSALRSALEDAPVVVAPVTTATAAAGIIVGMILITGLGLRMTSIVLSVSGGILPIALVLTMVVALVLGMGMPSSSAYIIMATLLAPGLIELGVSTIAAHMFAFYFACISAITPPVALASYAAAGIANADTMKTGFAGFKLGIAAFIVPFIFVYGPPILLIGDFASILLAVTTSIVGVFALSAAVQGWLVIDLNPALRVLTFFAALLLIKPGITTDLIGFATLGAIYLIQHKNSRAVAKGGTA